MQERAFATDTYEVFRLELVQMMRQGRVWNVQLFLNLADNKTLWITRQKHLHDPNPRVRSHRREHIRVLNYLLDGFLGLDGAHISIFPETWRSVKRVFRADRIIDHRQQVWHLNRIKNAGSLTRQRHRPAEPPVLQSAPQETSDRPVLPDPG